MSKKLVLIPLAAGGEEIEVVTIFDVLDRCDIEPLLLAVGEASETKLSHGLVIQASGTIGDHVRAKYNGDISKFIAALDGVLLPGGMPGATNLRASRELEVILKGLQGRKLIGAICASPAVVFVPLAIVKSDSKATCYPGMKSRFEESQIPWIDAPVVYDRSSNVLTSQGPGTTAGFALVAAALLNNVEVAERVDSAMLTNWKDTIKSIASV